MVDIMCRHHRTTICQVICMLLLSMAVQGRARPGMLDREGGVDSLTGTVGRDGEEAMKTL